MRLGSVLRHPWPALEWIRFLSHEYARVHTRCASEIDTRRSLARTQRARAVKLGRAAKQGLWIEG